jgi:hypothetical protein
MDVLVGMWFQSVQGLFKTKLAERHAFAKPPARALPACTILQLNPRREPGEGIDLSCRCQHQLQAVYGPSLQCIEAGGARETSAPPLQPPITCLRLRMTYGHLRRIAH